MATVRTRVTDWTSGEWTPNLAGRVDVDKYSHSAAILENLVILQGGGVRRRPGTSYVATAKGSLRVRLVPFIFNESDAYTLEISGNDSATGGIRFYKNTARVESSPGVPVEVGHGYLANELRSIKFVQSNDVLFLVHPLHPPARLERLTLDGLNWRLSDIVFTAPPTREYGSRPGVTVTPGATSGSGVTFTASSNYFLAADAVALTAGRRIICTAGASTGARALITGVTDAQHVVCTIESNFASTAAIPAGSWIIDSSPVAGVTPAIKGPVGSSTTLTAGINAWRSDDVGKYAIVNDGCFRIDSLVSATVANVSIFSEASGVTQAPAGAWTLEEPSFSPLNGYPSEVTFHAGRLWFFATPAEPQHGWASKTGDFYNFAVGSLADDSLSFTIDSDQANPIRWARPLGRILAFGTLGEEWIIDAGEGTALTPTSLSDSVRRAGTAYGSTGLVRPILIANVLLFVTASRMKVREFVADKESVFSLSYVAPDLTLLADHLTATAVVGTAHVTRRICEVALQREPTQTVWAVREDGTLLSLTYLRDQNVVGWARHVLTPAPIIDAEGRRIPTTGGGIVESVCVIPHPDGDRDQVWLSTARNFGAGFVRYVEVMEERGLNFTDGLVTDATLVYDGQQYASTLTLTATSGAGVSVGASPGVFSAGMVGAEIREMGGPGRGRITIYTSPTAVAMDITQPFASTTTLPGGWGIAVFGLGGLTHLEGVSVAIVGDGAVYPPQAVASGIVSLAYAAVKVEVGLGFPSRLVTAHPEVAGLGTIQAMPQRHAPVYLRLRNTLGVTLDGTLIPFRRGGDPLGIGSPVFTGDLKVPHLGWDTQGRLTIEQTQPLPMTLLGLYSLLGTED